MRFYKITFLISLLCLIGCDKSSKYEDKPLRTIYISALEKMKKGDFESSGDEFLEVDRQYPYSEWASRAILMSAFCYYKNGKLDEAIRNLEIFTKFNTRHRFIDYAYYLKALCYLKQINSSKKDMSKADDALLSLRQLIRGFPTSKYIPAARNKIVYLNNLLAAHEMCIGRFYQLQKNFLAALKHFETVIEFYFNTPQMPEAYYRYIESLTALGLFDEAKLIYKKMPHIEDKWYNFASDITKKFVRYKRYRLEKL